MIESKIEKMKIEDRKKLDQMLLANESYDHILAIDEFKFLNKTNLCLYKKKLLGNESTPSITPNKTERLEVSTEYILNSLIDTLLECDSQISSLKAMRSQTVGLKTCIANFISKKSQVLSQLESYVNRLENDIKIDTKLLCEFLIFRRQRQLEGGNKK